MNALASEVFMYLEYFLLDKKVREVLLELCIVERLSTIALPSPINLAFMSLDNSNKVKPW
jgi:hypothetical protein